MDRIQCVPLLVGCEEVVGIGRLQVMPHLEVKAASLNVYTSLSLLPANLNARDRREGVRIIYIYTYIYIYPLRRHRHEGRFLSHPPEGR